MRFFLIVLVLGLLTSCNQKKRIDSTLKSDSLIVDSKYVKNTWNNYFRPIKTPLGITIEFKIIEESRYIIQWGNSMNLRTLPDTFNLDGHETWIPKFIDESKDYIVLRKGCGNPCWIGYFLPTNDSIKPVSVNDYLGYNLDDNLIAYINDNSIEVIDLKTRKTETHKMEGCNSAFLGYCIDSLSIKNRTLIYKWIPETLIKSKESKLKTEKIKL
mgnify:CR=1 FL=1